MIHIRTARRTDAAGVARVHARTWKEAYQGLLDSTFLDNLSERRLATRWRAQLDRRAQDLDEEVLVAVNGQEIVGFASMGSSREAFAPWEAEVSMVYVLKEQRGIGIGKGRALADQRHEGITPGLVQFRGLPVHPHFHPRSRQRPVR